tara:strand:- start:159 stop:434 length:276 start_codon:yes stop_codon:yes gene_type:complete
MGPWKPITTEAALGTNTGAASNVGNSRYVRLWNKAAVGTEYLVTLEESGGTDIGTFTLDGQQEAIIQKDPSDQLFAGNANVMAVGIAINSN